MTIILEAKHKDQVYGYLSGKLPEIKKAPLKLQKVFCFQIDKLMKNGYQGKYDMAVSVKAKPFSQYSGQVDETARR